MSELDIPVPSYRLHRAAPMFDAPTKRMAAIAGGVGGVLLLAFVGWQSVGRRPAAIPVIEADSRPLRVKPDNPGGMTIVGADEQVMGGAGATGEPERLAAPPETPAPQALRAQIQAARQAPPAPTPGGFTLSPAPATPSVAPAPPASPASPPVEPARRPTQAAAAPTPVTTPAPVAPPAAGTTQVQFAAMDSEQAAQEAWSKLQRKMPDVIGTHRPTVQRAESGGRTVWRLRTGGFTDMAQAASFCERVRSKGGSCTIASF